MGFIARSNHSNRIDQGIQPVMSWLRLVLMAMETGGGNVKREDSSMNEVVKCVRLAQAGDREAFGELVKRFQFTVHAVAKSRLHDDHEAEEVAQDVFIHAMKKLDQLKEPERFAGWLRQMTLRMAINRSVRRKLFQTLVPEIVECTEASGMSPLDEMCNGDMEKTLHLAIDRLKPADRETLVQHHLQNRSLKQMSRECKAPLGTIKRRLHVARKRLKKILEDGPMTGGAVRKKGMKSRKERHKSAVCV